MVTPPLSGPHGLYTAPESAQKTGTPRQTQAGQGFGGVVLPWRTTYPQHCVQRRGTSGQLSPFYFLADGMLRDVLAQRRIHTGLPAFAGGLEGLQQVGIQSDGGEHLGGIGLGAATGALGHQCGIQGGRQGFAGGLDW